MSAIGRLNETQVHEQLKQLYCHDDGQMEVEVDGFVVDVRNQHEIVEIQTRGFFKLRRKIETLSQRHSLRIVHPICTRTIIIKYDSAGKQISRRSSPKRGRIEHLYRELVSIGDLLPNPAITIDVPFILVEEERRDDGRGSWRRRGVSIVGRRLVEIGETSLFHTAEDFLSILPVDLPEQFTHKELGERTGLRIREVQPITSALRKMGLLEVTALRGREYLFRRI